MGVASDVQILVHNDVATAVRPAAHVDGNADGGRMAGSVLNVHAQHGELAAHALGAKAAVSVKPNTPASAVLPFLDKVDMILVMTVEPGFGGQSFLENQMEKLAALGALCAERNPKCLLEVDGGVNAQTGALCRQSGANVLVAGSAFFKAKDKAAFVKEIEAAV